MNLTAARRSASSAPKKGSCCFAGSGQTHSQPGPRWLSQTNSPLTCCTPARQLGQRKVSLVVASSSARSVGSPSRLHFEPLPAVHSMRNQRGQNVLTEG